MFLQTLNIEWGQIDPKDNRRIKVIAAEKSCAGEVPRGQR